MFKRNSYFLDLIKAQIFWVFIITFGIYILDLIFYCIIGLNYDIGNASNIEKIYTFMHNYGKIGLIFTLDILALIIVEKKKVEQFQKYFRYAIDFLMDKDDHLNTFHSSLDEIKEDTINLKREYKQLKKDYEIAYREKTDLLTYLAHDMKTPIANLLGYATILDEEKDLNKTQREKFIKIIVDNTNHLNNITNDFFSYLKFNLQEIPVNFEKFDIIEFFKDWIREREITLKDKKLKLNFGPIDKNFVKTDSDLLIRLLDNLFTNAKKYSAENSIIDIKVGICDYNLIINMKNTIPEDLNLDMNQLRKKFYRGDFSRNRYKNNGSGLGLVISDFIVEHLKGKLEIEKNRKEVMVTVKIPTNL